MTVVQRLGDNHSGDNDAASARPRLLVAGASVRAAVEAAGRWGVVRPVAADLFQDQDLNQADACWLLRPGYRNLPKLARDDSQLAAWMYTGALENYPQIVDRVRLPLLGNPADVLRQVRDPFQVVAALRDEGLACLEVTRVLTGSSASGRWLSKPLASAAGREIRFANSARGGRSRPGRYFQRWTAGQACAAAFVASPRGCRLLGVTRQLIGPEFGAPGPFQYAGSLGPLQLDRATHERWERIGQVVASRFRLIGLFGIDAIDTGSELMPVEVNPRYVASLEVLERGCGWNAIELHWRACCDDQLPTSAPLGDLPRAVGKRIVYAARMCQADAAFGAWVRRQNAASGVRIADIPAVGTAFKAGDPIATVIIDSSPGTSAQNVAAALAAAAREVACRMTPPPA